MWSRMLCCEGNRDVNVIRGRGYLRLECKSRMLMRRMPTSVTNTRAFFTRPRSMECSFHCTRTPAAESRAFTSPAERASRGLFHRTEGREYPGGVDAIMRLDIWGLAAKQTSNVLLSTCDNDITSNTIHDTQEFKRVKYMYKNFWHTMCHICSTTTGRDLIIHSPSES
jgi:hypothetical protein